MAAKTAHLVDIRPKSFPGQTIGWTLHMLFVHTVFFQFSYAWYIYLLISFTGINITSR